jgi:pimeloyl-ACP methyl ester carboxylesterase
VKYFSILISFLVSASGAFSQTPTSTDPRLPYKTGYRNILCIDSTRTYKPNTSAGNKLHFRPVEIDFWYPTENSTPASSLSYGYFLDLLQQRSNRFQDDTVYKQMGSDLLTYLSVNLKIKDTSKLSGFPTSSVFNAKPVPKRFPLILYFCSYNGMSYENLPLFEFLASQGFLVACITSVGQYPGNMSTQMPDLMEQVRDGEFVLRYLNREETPDSLKIGVLGYSWGGLAALILAMQNNQVKCLLSLDGSEMHYYGDSKEEDMDFDQLRNSPDFNLKKLNIPYAYLESGFKQSEQDADSVFNILKSYAGQKLYVHFPKADHEDFSALPSVGNSIAKADPALSPLYIRFQQFALYYFDRYLKGDDIRLPAWLHTVFQSSMGDSVYPVIKFRKGGIRITGRVVDEKNREELAYVNVGIQNKNLGTVSAPDGRFQLNIDSVLKDDSIRFSMAGYKSFTAPVAEFLKTSRPLIIPLKENVSGLQEVVISAKAMKTEIRGNTTTSNFVNIGLPLRFLGSETGIRLALGKKPVLLKSFSFNISDNRVDTAVFRLNIYNFKNGKPHENILHQNILVPLGKQTGRYTLNLTDYKLVLGGDVLISLEWIEGSYSKAGHGALFLSAGFLNSATWHRLTSQAEWKKASGLGVGFNVVIQKLNN